MLGFGLSRFGSQREEREAPLASFLPTRMEPGGCFLFAASFNLLFLSCSGRKNTHSNRRARYHTLAQTQQRTITTMLTSALNTQTLLDFTLIRHLVWLVPRRPTLRPLAVMSSLLQFFFFSPIHCPISLPSVSQRPSLTFGLVKVIKSSSRVCILQIVKKACSIH